MNNDYLVYYESIKREPKIRGIIRLRTNCSDKTNKQIGNVFVSPFVLMSVLLFCVVK